MAFRSRMIELMSSSLIGGFIGGFLGYMITSAFLYRHRYHTTQEIEALRGTLKEFRVKLRQFQAYAKALLAITQRAEAGDLRGYGGSIDDESELEQLQTDVD